MARMPQVSGVEHRHVDAGGLRMHIAEAAEGEPVLLLHGWPQNWYMWRGVIPPLARDYRVIAPDLRGFGWTDAPATGYEKESMAADIVRLMDALELDRVRLAGHDWGGWIGFLLCLRHPERIERFLALNVGTPWPKVTARNGLELWRFWYQLAIATPWLGEYLIKERRLARAIIKLNAGDRKAWTGTELNAFLKPLRAPEQARASSLLYRTFLTKELLPIARGRYSSERLTTPTLMLFGVQDKAVSRRLVSGHKKHADDMRVEFVKKSGHWIAEEDPDLVVDRALELFGADGGDPGRASGAVASDPAAPS